MDFVRVSHLIHGIRYLKLVGVRSKQKQTIKSKENFRIHSGTLLTYNQVCSTSSQCNSSLGLICTSQICQCDGYHSWVSLNNTCVTIVNNTLNYGDTCAVGSSQCNSSVELTCTGNCTCKNSKVWNISTCVCPAATFLNSSNLCRK
ncbi:unnamed protein product, partial [Rotaria magnacalcarata]